MTTLTKNQKKIFEKELPNGDVLLVTVRHDDECGNGHNTFTITGSLYDRNRIPGEEYVTNSKGKKRYLGSCGCLHNEVREHFPELASLLKWHLCSTDGPLHYIANTVYHAERGDLEAARESAVWPEVTLDQLRDEQALRDRLPALLEEFRRDVEAFGLKY